VRTAQTCYACDDPATSKEHCPPRVFFPEVADVGADHRSNLITVPSCDAHNARRSEDDAYVAYMVCVCLGNNDLALTQVATKVKRSIEKRPDVVARMFAEASPVRVGTLPTAALRMDLEAFRCVMASIARGIFFHCTGEKLTRPMVAISPQLSDTTEAHPDWAIIQVDLERQPWEEGVGCENPDVFYFRWIRGAGAFRFEFYRGFSVYVIPEPAAKVERPDAT
jgi:hypothetical protein